MYCGPHDSSSVFLYIKPIFHCDAKPFALGSFASPNAKDSTFALPNAKNSNMLVSLALGDANLLCWPCTFLFFCVTPDANPRRQSVEYRSRWAFWRWGWRWPCTFHIFLCRFHLRLVVNANPVSSGIWALVSDMNNIRQYRNYKDMIIDKYFFAYRHVQ